MDFALLSENWVGLIVEGFLEAKGLSGAYTKVVQIIREAFPPGVAISSSLDWEPEAEWRPWVRVTVSVPPNLEWYEYYATYLDRAGREVTEPQSSSLIAVSIYACNCSK